MSELVSSRTLNEMVKYYRARANEYDEWFYRRGRFDLGSEANARWFTEAGEVFTAHFASFGFDIVVRETETYFLYGYGMLRISLE